MFNSSQTAPELSVVGGGVRMQLHGLLTLVFKYIGVMCENEATPSVSCSLNLPFDNQVLMLVFVKTST